MDSGTKKTQSNIAEEFDRFADNYSSDMLRFVPYYKKQLSSIIEYLPLDFKPKRIIDIGCGNGNATALLIGKFPAAEFTLVDASPEMLQICQNRFPDTEFKIIHTYFQDLNLPSASYDLAIAVLSLHHLKVDEKKNIFSLIRNSLKKGGMLLSSDLMIDKDDESHPRLIEDWHQFMMDNNSTQDELDWMMDHYAKFDHPSDWRKQTKWLKEVGFETVKIPWRIDYWTHFQAVK